MEINHILQELMNEGNRDREQAFSRFFKTGPGEYGEGDRFIGVMVPTIRVFVRRYSMSIGMHEVLEFVQSPYHEIRLFGLLCWVSQHKKVSPEQQEEIYRLYIQHRMYVNNWDLVDLSAPHIVGPHASVTELKEWAQDSHLWTRRIAMLATFFDICRHKPEHAIHIATILKNDPHDLIQKAVGWMLREVGKRCGEQILEEFLRAYSKEMPRTMLRYAIERLDSQKRSFYMRK